MRKKFQPAPRYALPFGINLSDFDFTPSREEILLDRCREMKTQWDREDDARRRVRAAQVAAEIQQARVQQQHEDAAAALEREIADSVERDRLYWLKEREKGAEPMAKLIEHYQDQLDGGWRKKALAKLDKHKKEIQRDRLKAERELLASRGLIRGRR